MILRILNIISPIFLEYEKILCVMTFLKISDSSWKKSAFVNAVLSPRRKSILFLNEITVIVINKI